MMYSPGCTDLLPPAPTTGTTARGTGDVRHGPGGCVGRGGWWDGTSRGVERSGHSQGLTAGGETVTITEFSNGNGSADGRARSTARNGTRWHGMAREWHGNGTGCHGMGWHGKDTEWGRMGRHGHSDGALGTGTG
ncbi:hypothetical protein Nmel_016665, partial [Mimus melanotis]